MRVFVGSTEMSDPNTDSYRKKNKKVAEEVSKGLIEKIRERTKVLDPNFWVDDEGTGLFTRAY
jgi:hypothetical protein